MEKTCFVVCPIGEEGSTVRKNSDQLLRYVLKPICEKNGFECIRVDELNDSDSITDTIINYLKTADLVIADLSGHNPNAFFELGYRTALGKNAIHLMKKNEKIPFDVSTIRTFSYDLSDLDSVAEVKDRIDKTIQNMKFDNDTPKTEILTQNVQPQIFDELFKIQDQLDKINNAMRISTLIPQGALRNEPVTHRFHITKNDDEVSRLFQDYMCKILDQKYDELYKSKTSDNKEENNS